jgi:hypothetical protein
VSAVEEADSSAFLEPPHAKAVARIATIINTPNLFFIVSLNFAFIKKSRVGNPTKKYFYLGLPRIQ